MRPRVTSLRRIVKPSLRWRHPGGHHQRVSVELIVLGVSPIPS